MKSLLLLALSITLSCGEATETKLPLKVDSLIQTSEVTISKAFSLYKNTANKELEKLCISLEKEMKELGKKGDIESAALIKKKIDEIKAGTFLQNFEDKLQETKNDDDLLGGIDIKDVRIPIIGKWKINIPGKISEQSYILIDKKFNSTLSDGTSGKVINVDNIISIKWSNNTIWTISILDGEFYANGKIKFTK